jgi:hypothetical protein
VPDPTVKQIPRELVYYALIVGHQEYLLTLIAKEKHKDGVGLEPTSGSD